MISVPDQSPRKFTGPSRPRLVLNSTNAFDGSFGRYDRMLWMVMAEKKRDVPLVLETKPTPKAPDKGKDTPHEEGYAFQRK